MMTLFSYEIPRWDKQLKQGFILKWEDDRGHIGYGEVSPLKGRSFETGDDIIHAFKEPIYYPPSLLFGYEMAKLPPLDEDIHFQVTHLSEDIHWIPEYNEAIKIKLGSLSLQKALTWTKKCLEKTRNIRIELNKKWDLKKAKAFFSHFKEGDFVFIEDPIRHYRELIHFYEETGFSIALDEYLIDRPIELFLSLKGLTHLVIKPSLHGGIDSCKRIQQLAPHLELYFSSLLETNLGLMQIIRLQKELGLSALLGIDTQNYLLDNLMPLDLVYGPKILSKNLYNHPPLDFSKLRPLSNLRFSQFSDPFEPFF